GPLKRMGQGLGNAAKRYVESYKAAFEGIGDAFRALGRSKAFKVFRHHAKEAGKAVGRYADDVASGLVSQATTLINWSDKAIQGLINAGKAVGDFVEDVVDEGKDFVEDVVDGGKDFVEDVVEVVNPVNWF
ncbi:MAG: hypothetical protein AAFV29_13265, partial [Myxococcota bacterium]